MKRFSILRISIVLFLIPFCIYLFYLVFSHVKMSGRSESVKDDKGRQGVTKIEKFEMKGLEQERTSFHLNADKFTQAEEGIFQLEKIGSLVLHTADGRKVTVSADRGTMMEKGKDDRQIIADGNVVLSLEDGTQIKTQKLVYDQKNQKVKTEGGVSLRKGTITASAAIMDYDLDEEQITLSPEFIMEIAGKENVIVRSGSFTGRLNLREGVLGGGVNIRNSRSQISSAEASIIVDEKGEEMECLDLSGGVNGKGSFERQGRTNHGTIQSESLQISFEKGDISGIDLIGKVSIMIQDSESQPSSVRWLKCDGLSVKKISSDRSQAEISGNVAIRTEANGAEKAMEELSCDSLSILFFRTEKIEIAHAEGNVLYTSPQAGASCEKVDFRGSDSHITMLESGKKHPSVKMEGWEVHAQKIELKGDSDMSASGEVKSSYINEGGSKDAVPIFESDKVVFIASDHLSVKEKNDILYSGNVRAWQEDNSISARELRIDLNGKSVEARGDVISRFRNVSSLKSTENDSDQEEERSAQKAEVHADSLVYSSGTSKALYSGHVTARMQEREITCGELEIQLSKQAKAEKMFARQDVLLRSSNFSAKGEGLRYDMSDRSAVMNGNADPARVYDERGRETVVAPSLTFHMSDDKMTLISRDGGRTWITLEPVP